MGSTNKWLDRQMAERHVAVWHLEGNSGAIAVLIEASWTEAVDGEGDISKARQPIGPGDHVAMKAATTVHEHNGGEGTRTQGTGQVAGQPNRPSFWSRRARHLDELARRGVGSDDGRDGDDECGKDILDRTSFHHWWGSGRSVQPRLTLAAAGSARFLQQSREINR